MIETKSLKFDYIKPDNKHINAIKNIDIKLNRGEFTTIIGHNGSGKSTFAKLMNATLLPSGGKIYVLGMDTQDDNWLWEIRRNAGMVFQNPDNQIVATIVEEDVAFGPENLAVHPDEIRKRVDDALASVNMSAHVKKPPHLLSGGQKQRVAIAGVLAMKPQCIILDEPTAMLDPAGRKEVLETISYLNKVEGITIVLITHFMDEAVLADRVIVMEKGEVIMDDIPKKIFCHVERLQELGLDVPQVTLLAHELKKSDIEVSEDILTVDEMVEELCRLL
jgi:energy-coupling factor transport system ATP-binding protein